MADAVRGVRDVTLANVHADPDHHRAVFTFLGEPGAVAAAAQALADVVLAEIDMRDHHGIHPRIGALAERYALPVYYYGDAARRPERRALRELRHGEYEGLAARLGTDDGRPDDG